MTKTPRPDNESLYSLIDMTSDDLFEDKEKSIYLVPIHGDDVGYLMRPQDVDHARVFMTHAEIYDALSAGRAEIHCGGITTMANRMLAHLATFRWDDLSEKNQVVALWRARLLNLFDARCETLGVKRIAFTDRSLKPHLKSLGLQANVELLGEHDFTVGRDSQPFRFFRTPSAKTFKRWHDLYHASGRDAASLVPRYTSRCLPKRDQATNVARRR